LPTGTWFVKENVDRLTTLREFTKAGLPSAYVASAEELIGKRVRRPYRKGEIFDSADLHTPAPALPAGPEGTQTVALPYEKILHPVPLGPGTKLVVYASFLDDVHRKVFLLLPDVRFVSLVRDAIPDPEQPAIWLSPEVEVAVNHKQAQLIALAKERKCVVSASVRVSDSQVKDYDMEKTFALVEGLGTKPIAPAPRPKE
ncbi:MAG: SAF domain-containing protein, partial [Gemmataceae bacterium]